MAQSEDAKVDRSPAKAAPALSPSSSGRLTPDQMDFIDWLCEDPDFRVPPTQNKWEAEHGYGAGTVSRWKNTNKGFRAVLRARFDDVNTSPEQVQAVIGTLYRAALRGDVKAAVDWMRVTGNFVDKQIVQQTDKPSDLSDAELAAELRENLAILEAKEVLSGK